VAPWPHRIHVGSAKLAAIPATTPSPNPANTGLTIPLADGLPLEASDRTLGAGGAGG
jgi:hypothetical protein